MLVTVFYHNNLIFHKVNEFNYVRTHELMVKNANLLSCILMSSDCD